MNQEKVFNFRSFVQRKDIEREKKKKENKETTTKENKRNHRSHY
jgi:hypothetical protein